MAASTRRVFEKTTTKRGRSLFTSEAVKAGQVLFEEEPIICNQFSWNSLCQYEACEFCMRSLETAEENARRLTRQPNLQLPHTECCVTDTSQHRSCDDCGARYCSEVCRLTALNRYHSVLCQGYSRERSDHPLQILDTAWRELHYPPETTSIGLITKLIALIKQSGHKSEVVKELSQFCSRSKDEQSNSLHKLLGEQFKSGLEMMREMLRECLYDEHVDAWFSPEGFKSLFALIGTNGQGIGTSSLSVWVRNCDALDLAETERQELDTYIDNLYKMIDEADKQCDGDGMQTEYTHDAFLNCEGSGLYLTQSSANHSCVPNAEISFPYNNSVLRFTALQDLEANQEVFISYLDECMLSRSRHTRQNYLRENYVFICDCEKCASQRDDPDLTSSDDDESDDDMSAQDAGSDDEHIA